MKKLILVLVLLTLSLAAFAQRGPHRRFPRPPGHMNAMKCEVLMIDNWHRVYRVFKGRMDVFSGRCARPMHECLRSLPRRNRDLRCVSRNGRW